MTLVMLALRIALSLLNYWHSILAHGMKTFQEVKWDQIARLLVVKSVAGNFHGHELYQMIRSSDFHTTQIMANEIDIYRHLP